ncbi:MAG: hypothetical protein ACI33I_03240, partial [Clostridium sp.]
MREKVNKIIKKKTVFFRSLIILSVIFVFGVSAKIVYSNSQFNIKIKYLEDIFEPENNMNNSLFFNSAQESELRFEVDLSEYYEGRKDSLGDSKDSPFTVESRLEKKVGRNQDIDANAIKIEPIIEKNNEFQGKYTVKLTIPEGNNDDKVYIKILASQNQWGIKPGLYKEFNIIRDLKKPEIIVNGINTDSSLENDKIIVELKDEYKDTGDINVNISNDGVAVKKIKNNDGALSYVEITVSKDGDYTGTITAKDKAENMADEKEIKFFVNKNAPTIKIN